MGIHYNYSKITKTPHILWEFTGKILENSLYPFPHRCNSPHILRELDNSLIIFPAFVARGIVFRDSILLVCNN